MAVRKKAVQDKAVKGPVEHKAAPAPQPVASVENAARPLSHDEKLRAQYDDTADLARAGGDSSESHRSAVASGATQIKTFEPKHLRHPKK